MVVKDTQNLPAIRPQSTKKLPPKIVINDVGYDVAVVNIIVHATMHPYYRVIAAHRLMAYKE